jgi:hypothetical protein
MADLLELVTRLRQTPAAYSSQRPAAHPKAASLVLPDGSRAPAALRAWAAFDNRYPSELSERRSDLVIADRKGVVKARPMKAILAFVCVDSIRDELEGDREGLAYVRNLARGFAAKLPGFGVLLAPDDQPDRILWLPPKGTRAIVMRYEDDRFDVRIPFADWVRGLFA